MAEPHSTEPSALFSPEQTEAIRRNRKFLERLWHLDNDERPAFMIGYTGPRMIGGTPVRSALFSTEGDGTVRDRLQNPETYLQAQLEEIRGQLLFRGDYVPALCPALGVVGIPSAFGCEVLWWERDFPAVKAVRDLDLDALDDFPIPGARDGELGRILDYTSYFIEHTRGQLPIRLADIQGPLDSAALVVGHTNFLGAMMTHPDAVHRLMRRITNLTIAFVKRQRELTRNAGVEFIPAMFQPWMPDGFGVSVSNDECVMISPELHDEFHVPYLNMLSEEFGGIYIHSCGDWTHQFPSLERVYNLRGLEFGSSETWFGPVAERFGGRIVLACRVGLHRDRKFDGMADYVRAIRRAAATSRGLFINVDITNGIIDDSWPVTDLNELYQLLEVPQHEQASL